MTIIILLLSIGSHAFAYSYISNQTVSDIIIKDNNEIEITANSDYYIKLDLKDIKLEKKKSNPLTLGLTENEINAVIKSPIWLQRKLIQQFKNITNSNDYASLIIESELKYTDEIAFSIAHSPLGNIPPVDVIKENVKNLYDIDSYLKYADIIDYDQGNGYYYSTVRYQILEKNTIKKLEYPMDIYYWYIVHPIINREEPMLVYNKTWREYFFYHNDVGHPLIKEKLYDVEYVWDGNSISDNITEIQAITDWVSNNIRYEIIGNRSGQPNIIAHEHTGYCGETQKIVAAAHRTALTPINGIMNYAEDHVWCEFYEREWYHIDGAINNPYMYTDGWGKDMSSIWAWNGDSSIYEVTSRYLHPEETINVEFNVVDGYNKPIDGVVVTVLVKGLKDITWYKEYFKDIINNIWDQIPDIFRGVLLENIYNKLILKIDEIDEVIEASQISIWNYTDFNGKCQFKLGKNDEYIFLVQKTDLRYPWPLSKFNRIKTLSDTKDIEYKICFFDFSNKIQDYKILDEINGIYNCNINLNLSAYQLQKNIITGDIGTYNFDGKIDFFILNEENFDLYKDGKKFNCYYYQELKSKNINFSLDENNYYIIFRNNAQRTNIILEYDLTVKSSNDKNIIKISAPYSTILEIPSYCIGTIVNIDGISTSNSVEISIVNKSEIKPVNDNKWTYKWDTKNLKPYIYKINVKNEHSNDSISIKLIDQIPPNIKILNPNDMDIFENDFINISGKASDNYLLNKIELIIDENPPINIDLEEEWFYNFNIGNLKSGEYTIKAIAYDYFGLTNYDEIKFIKNTSDTINKISINSVFIDPINPTNQTRITVYSNVTSEDPFSIKKVIISYDNGSDLISKEMFIYGDFPNQERHVEDDIQNIPNNPIYGIDLGKFRSGEIINYWIEAFDTANNSKKSSIYTIKIS